MFRSKRQFVFAPVRFRISPPKRMRFPPRSLRRFLKGPPWLIRRGCFYGPPLEGDVDDDRDRGIIGAFICVRLHEQLYSVLRWMQKTDFSDAFGAVPGGFKSQDLLCGNRAKPGASTRARLANGGPDPAGMSMADFIEYRGGVSLFLPSLAALRVLASQPAQLPGISETNAQREPVPVGVSYE